MEKLSIEINSDSLDSLNLKLAAACELAETLKELLEDIGGKKASTVNLSHGSPFPSSEDAKRMMERISPLFGSRK